MINLNVLEKINQDFEIKVESGEDPKIFWADQMAYYGYLLLKESPINISYTAQVLEYCIDRYQDYLDPQETRFF